MNAKMIEGLIAIRNGIDLVLESQKTVDTISAENKVAPKKVQETKKVEAPVEEVEEVEVETVTGTISKEQLDAMTYNDLKKFAKEVGVSAVGARAQLTEKILNAGVIAPVEAVTEEEPVEEEEAPRKAITSKPQVRGKKAQAPVEEEPVEEEDEEEEDPLVAQVMEAVEDMTTEEIADFLTDSGISAKGKREALIAKVVKAVKEGVIELDNDDEDEDEETQEATEDVEEFDEEAYRYVNDPKNPDMTDERRTALKAFAKSTKADFKAGEITREDMVEFLQSFFETDDEMTQWKDSQVLDEYIDSASRVIDDEGEIVEEGAYIVNGQPYCCANPLPYDEETGMYRCARCEEEYEIEE